VLLSGDNALVIALACRGLHPGSAVGHDHWCRHRGDPVDRVHRHRRKRDGFAISENWPAASRCWLSAAKLLVPEDGGDDVIEGTSLWHAVRLS